MVALFTRAWIEILSYTVEGRTSPSPSSRGRGLKCRPTDNCGDNQCVALFTRAWIEILQFLNRHGKIVVALFTRAWIEISVLCVTAFDVSVALFTRAWIEIYCSGSCPHLRLSPSSRGRGLKLLKYLCRYQSRYVALFTRAWIEIASYTI